MKIIIDNTRSAGNFFDNINNNELFAYEILVNEYNKDHIKDFIKSNSTIKIENQTKEDLDKYYSGDFSIYSSLEYDYINENNLSEYINDVDEMLFSKQDKWFKLTKNQYAQKLAFREKHHDCLIDKETKRHRFGTIGGGIVIKYKMYSDSIVPFIRCEYCGEELELKDEFPEDFNIPITELDKKYEIECKYPDKLNKVEFYRLLQILKDVNYNPIEIGFMGTGLGNLVSVKTKNYIYSITDCSHW